MRGRPSVPSAPRKSAAVVTCHTGRQDDWREWNMKIVLIRRKRSKKDLVKCWKQMEHLTWVLPEEQAYFAIAKLCIMQAPSHSILAYLTTCAFSDEQFTVESLRWNSVPTAAAWGGVARGRHQQERHLAQTLQKARASATKMFTGFGGGRWKQLIFCVVMRLGTASSDVPRKFGTIWKRCSVDQCGQFCSKMVDTNWYKQQTIVVGLCWNPVSGCSGASPETSTAPGRTAAAHSEGPRLRNGTVGGCLQGWKNWLFTLAVLSFDCFWWFWF